MTPPGPDTEDESRMPVNESKAPTSRKRQKIGPNLFGRDGPFQVIREVQGKQVSVT